MEERIIAASVLIGSGVFSIAGAVFNWDWLLSNPIKAQIFDNFLGRPLRDWARFGFLSIGVLFVVAGLVIGFTS